MNKVISLFEHFIESHVKSPRHDDPLYNSIKLKFLATKTARLLGTEMPMYCIDDIKNCDSFSFWNNNETMHQMDDTSWHVGGVSCLCIEQFENPELTKGVLAYCPDTLSDGEEDGEENISDYFSLETFSIAAALSLANNLIDGYQNEEDEGLASDRELFEQLINAEDTDEKLGILEELSINWTYGISYAFHRKFEEHLDYPDDLYGEIASAAISWVIDEFFFDSSLLHLNYDFLDNMAYQFLGMLSRSGDEFMCSGVDIDCTFFIHPKGNAILAGGDKLLTAYREFLTNTICHDCEVVICSAKDELAIGVLHSTMENLDWISLATYLFIHRLDTIDKQQRITTENIPA